MTGRSRRFFFRNLVCSRQRLAIYNRNQLVLGPCVFVVVETFPEGCQTSFNLSSCQLQEHLRSRDLHTCNWRTVGLLKSSGPVYTPSVTRNPPSTPSSFRLRSRSWTRNARSFSSFRASLSALVSLRGSRAGSRSTLSPPLLMPRKDRSWRLPLPLREL